MGGIGELVGDFLHPPLFRIMRSSHFSDFLPRQNIEFKRSPALNATEWYTEVFAAILWCFFRTTGKKH